MNLPIVSFRSLKILHLSLLMGMALFAIVAFILAQENLVTALDESTNRILQVVAVISSVAFLFVGFNVFKRRIIAARNSVESAEKRMKQYTSACILWWAMIEAPGMIAMICYLLTGNLAFFFLGVFHFLILLIFMPRKENIVVLLNFSSQDISRIEGEA